jgi:hypothetical protein
MAAGLLTSWDPSYGLSRIVLPMAADDEPWPRLFAAVALDQSAREKGVTAAIRNLVRSFARGGEPKLRWTSAVVNAYGRVAGSVPKSLAEIARVGTTDDIELFAAAGRAAVALLGSPDPGQVLDGIAAWLEDTRRDRNDLGLLAAVRLAELRAGDVTTDDWTGATDGVSAAPDRSMPLAVKLAEVDEQWGQKAADLIWTALSTVRSREAATAAVTGWLREATASRPSLAAVAKFLPRLVDSEDDRHRLRRLVDRAVSDPDDPLPVEVARALWQDVKRMAPRREGAA